MGNGREKKAAKIREMIAAGATRAEIASALFCEVGTVYNFCRRHGIYYPLKKRGRRKESSLMPRREQIVARYDAGETLASIGREFGITRERVRQIVVEAGRAPRLPDIMASASAKRAMKVVAQQEKYEAHIAQYEPQIAAIMQGASIHSQVGSDRESERLARVCKKLGIQSKAATRWNIDREARARVIRDGILQGKTWDEVTADVAREEGSYRKQPRMTAVYQWARTHCPDLFCATHGRLPPPDLSEAMRDA